MSEKNGPGRPAKAPEDRKSELISLRVSPVLKAELARRASESGKTLGREAEAAILAAYEREEEDAMAHSDFMAVALDAFYALSLLFRSGRGSADHPQEIPYMLETDAGKMARLGDMALIFFEAISPVRDGERPDYRKRQLDLDETYIESLRDYVANYLMSGGGTDAGKGLARMLAASGHPDFVEYLTRGDDGDQVSEIDADGDQSA